MVPYKNLESTGKDYIPLKENNVAAYDNFWEQIADQSFAVTHQFIQAIINNYQK